MRVTRLQIESFRNYARADLQPSAGITVLHGDNAQGKTALLEAIYLCCTGRSHRTVRDRELIRWGEERARVRVDALRADGEHTVEIDIKPLERKRVAVNGTAVSRSGELMGHVTGVLFSPEDLRMVKDGPAERRRFIDMELSQIRPSYYYQLQRYNRALQQRGKLLRDMRPAAGFEGLLDAWDEQLAQSGAQIIGARAAFIEQLGAHAGALHREITGGREALSLAYQSAVEPGGEQDMARALREALFLAREQDTRRQITSVGPHRDDLLIRIDGNDARAYGSQGQQRSCALSVKLSELQVMKGATGEYPVLMLDDVMSELDPERRRQLLGALGEVQTIVTCTDLSDLAGARAAQSVRIVNGAIAEQ